MNDISQAAEQIRDHLAEVTRMRERARQEGLDAALHAVKRLQAQRFRATYIDFMDDRPLAVDLAEMHALTETLDHALAEHWLALGEDCEAMERYVRSWRLTGRREARERQLAVVQDMGRELERLTRSKPLLMALKLMRRPAHAAGLSALQRFLESGFAAFGTLGDAQDFLATITLRERQWIDTLFDAGRQECQRALARELARS